MREISAGGLVYHTAPNGRLLLLAIIDRFGKWSLPKGKQEPGESLEETALREIQEETSVQGEIEDSLGQIDYTYIDPKRGTVQKEVAFYLVRALTTEAVPQLEEIDEVVWVEPHIFMQRQMDEGYDNHTRVIEAGLSRLGVSPPSLGGSGGGHVD